MGRWQRFISRIFTPTTDLVATVDASEEGDALTVTLAIPSEADPTTTVAVLALDAARGRVRTSEGQHKLSDGAQRVIAAIAPALPDEQWRRSKRETAITVDEAQIPETLRALRAIADAAPPAADVAEGDAPPAPPPVRESANARAIKLAEKRALQYEFGVDFDGADALTVQTHVVSADGRVRLRPDEIAPPPPPAPAKGRRARAAPAPEPTGPRWVRQGKTYYMAPTEVAPDVQMFIGTKLALQGDAIPFFLVKQIKQLGKAGKVVTSEEVKAARVESAPLEPVSVLDLDAEGWLAVDVAYRGAGQQFSQSDITALPPDTRYLRRGNVWIPIDRKADRKLHDAIDDVESKLGARRDDHGRLRVAPGQGDEARRTLLDAAEIDESAAFQKFLADLAGFKKIEPVKPPKGLTANLREYQIEGYRWLAFLRRYFLNGVLADDMGLGKAGSLDTKILTPTGWKRMGDMEVGDRVINSQGGVSHVTGVYPQGEKDIYRVEFTDGSSTECCDEHLWYVNSALRRKRGYAGRVVPLAEIKETLKDSVGNNQHFIPMVQPIDFDEGELPLHPYLLGVILGDGGISTRSVVKITSADEELLDTVRTLLPEHVEVRLKDRYDWKLVVKDSKGGFGPGRTITNNPLLDSLRKLLLHGHTAHTKFIPDVYKFASVQSRLELLRGLMDTDGSIHDNVLEFTSVSERLIKDVQFLVQSLGGVARCKQRRTTWTHNGEAKEGTAYRLTIAMPAEFNPFKLKRKADLWKAREKYQPVRAFKSVTFVGRKEAQCIAVDAPDHLYVTDDCIVTHNTISVLALLQYGKEHPDAEHPDPTLVVCPTSCADNWIDEAAKFTPGLRVVRYIGPDRERLLLDPPDVLVTTYETLRRDMGYLQRQSWDYVILDEAQKIKNPITDTARACRQLLTRHRLAVTGTPIENRLDELWALFDFLMPGYLGSQARFRRDYEGPIMREKSGSVADDLKRKIAPFVLRRMKEQVAKDLPPKIYVARECKLTAEQSQEYARIAGEGRERVLEQARGGNVALTMSILASLTQLKQICCHPALLTDGVATQELHGRSGKFELFKEELAERLDAGDKILVFSQYAEMCKIIERYLKESGIPSLYLDGQTRNRQELVRTFQADPTIKVFVLSLRAAGFGITLTAASTVIHYDRWWNPAVENQATDRAYRIGQQRTVQVVQFRTVDTIEEKIDKLLTTKTELFDDVIESDEQAKTVTRQELLDLFTYSPLSDGATLDGMPVIAPVGAAP